MSRDFVLELTTLLCMQTFMYKVLEEDDATAAQYSLVVLVDLYRRRLWTSDHTGMLDIHILRISAVALIG